MKPWVFKTVIGGAVTVIIGGIGTWVTNASATRDDVIQLKVVLPAIAADIKEIKQDQKDMNSRLSNIEGQLKRR